ncbi:3-deoxy-D-manno-octulosonic acid transferase [Tamlana fucoidanivorans]|uniref:3-deoxy-D-manno-octulosonic acid transferase n=1 Tax=Allotamlana fucoidanivorans TaxID=2583814 RepID=A0A5C4SG33_9FLAO|nr:glycosyltransferase N-terminal domain-containing protein [Tamlana fucoidanivorans]TNJ42528.1 3-deoxy-D-manno-octulosonic acid transferase [Tamlana fucoidanivorans]
MNIIYNIGIRILGFSLQFMAHFNAKIKLGVEGRNNTYTILKNTLEPNDKTLWFHCASLGEYEQGLPVFKVLRQHYSNHKIVLSFFSPSGYEIRKSTPIADVVVYLPLDTKLNAKTFIDLIKPELTVFVKYDIWPNYLNQLKQNHYRAILISAALRANQAYFRFYGAPLRNALFAFEHIFTQNEESKTLLKSIHYNNVTVSGDTRFDRVSSQLNIDNTLSFIENFKDEKLCVVAGSTWPEDEALIIHYINNHASKNIKFIIAPHDIKPGQISNIKQALHVNYATYSNRNHQNLKDVQVFILDTIGILSKTYTYADIAYVGGAMGHTGLHNTLEPAVFGIPVIIGKNYSKFPEAEALIHHGGMFSVSNKEQFNAILSELLNDTKRRQETGLKNSNFIKKNEGAVIQITDYLRI